jgi:hypothetical protein
MADPYEVDDQGNPVVGDESDATADPAVTAAMRRQVEATLRFMALSTVVGLIVIAVLAVAVSSIRGVMILVGFVYLVTSVAAYWFLRRKFEATLARRVPAAPAESE